MADLEELNPTPGRFLCSQLFSQAIDVARRFYGNCHVYPYTYQGGYFYRNRMYKEALESWANAADTIRRFDQLLVGLILCTVFVIDGFSTF